MTTRQRHHVPDEIHTNGAAINPWWANAVVYQIYPRSFQDSNNDGYGDLNGITSRLGYLAELGIDAIWLSPVYRSPQDDNGYDIADYRDIDPMFGTLADMDTLIAKAHEYGIKIVMDLVVNHTSDEHAWFQASRRKDPEFNDWYWWRPAREGSIPGTPGAEPNLWGGTFGGSAWQYDEERGEYYLHTFSKKQPDLNWENPAVRHAVYDMMNWWLDRGIDGFRMDVITLISKRIDHNGKLPGESHSLIADEAPGEEGYSSPWPFSMDGPRLDEFLKEMRHEVFEGRDAYLTVGEGQGISPRRNEHITDPANSELDMLFLFDHVGVDQGDVKWDMEALELPKLKRAMIEQQEAVASRGWASLYFNNHDQPRALSRWGDTSTPELRIKSAKALGLLLHMHKGTPYVYQGEELGMTNAGFTSLDQYQDLESINAFHQRVDEAQVQSADSMLESLAKVSRDNSRTPMQWDDSRYGGFTSTQSLKAPWLPVNDNKASINANEELQDSDSVFAFYRQLIELRHTSDLIAAGSFEALDIDDEYVYAFKRSLGNDSALVVINTSSHTVPLPEQTYLILASGLDPQKVLLSNESVEILNKEVAGGELAPWSAFVYEI